MYSPRRFTAIRGGRTNPKENKYYRPYSEDLEYYLNSREYFNVIFPKLVRYRWRDSEACDETNNNGIVDDKSFENTLMFQTMAATWVATWECGISQEDMQKPGIVGAIYRLHVYFNVRRILRTRGRLAFYILDNTVRENVWNIYLQCTNYTITKKPEFVNLWKLQTKISSIWLPPQRRAS